MSTAARAFRRYDARLVGWLSVGQLITWGSVFYTFALLMEPVERELGLSRAQSSLAFSLALLAEGLLAYPVGRWIDRGHERAVMTGGSLLVAALLALHSQISSLAGFYAVWAGLGAALAATLYNPAFAVVTRRFPDDFRRAIITLTFLGGLASTVFIPLSAALVAQLGWRYTLWVLAALHLLVCAPLHAWVLRGAPRHALPGTASVATPAASTASPPAASPAALPATAAAAAAERPHGSPTSANAPPAPSEPAASLRHWLRNPAFVRLGIFVVVMMAVTAALPAHLVSLLRENRLAEAWVVAIPASIGVIQVAGRALLYFFEQRFDVHRANRLIPCLIPLGLAALLLAGWAAGWSSAVQTTAALLFVLLYGLGNGMLTIVKGTAMAQYVSRAHVASLNGALGLPMALARAVAPWLLGVLWSPARGYTLGIASLLAASLLAVAALWAAQKHALGRA